jgi:hypothetical protein
MKGHVTSQKRDKDGNPVGLANANPILDTHEYTVTFNNGDKTVLNANLIAEAMYVQCDPNGKKRVSWTLFLTTDDLTLQLDPLTKRLSDLTDIHT